MRKTLPLTIFISLYCLFVVLYLSAEFYNNKSIYTFFVRVGDPFLEQHWNMFAPNPPSSDKKILIKLYNSEKESIDSSWIELTGTIRDNNRYNFFGSSQRLIKYLHGTTDPILRSYQEGLVTTAAGASSTNNYQELSAFKALDAYIKLAVSRSDQYLLNCRYYKLRILDTPVAPIDSPAAERTTFIILDSDLIKL